MRPNLDENISLQDFKDFYWLKEELVQFCKAMGIDSSRGKLDIAKRIITFLETGKIVVKDEIKKQKTSSKFNWSKENISLKTVITDNYKNTENVRTFMTEHIGQHFHFTTEFMNWTKWNVGKTMAEAVEEWRRLYALKKSGNEEKEIAPQFEYNRYMKAFLADNPDKSSKDAMKYWRLKKQQRGSKEYNKSDLKLM
jgi:hypothetical protein